MPKKTIKLMPKSLDILKRMGEQIQLARLRRNIPVELVAERSGVSRTTHLEYRKRRTIRINWGLCCRITRTQWFRSRFFKSRTGRSAWPNDSGSRFKNPKTS